MCCRICLAKKVQKYVSELQYLPEIDKNHQDIMLFCFGIQVAEDPQVSTSLCNKCYQKVISFYIFKLQAIKNDVYLRSQHTKEEVKDTDINNQTSDISEVEDEPEIKIDYDDFQQDLNGPYQLDINEDQNELNLNVKAEDTSDTEKEESDNEVPSVLKTKKANNIYKGYSTEDEDYVPDEEIKTTLRKRLKPPQVCEQCGKSVTNLKEHMERHKDPADRKKFKCKNCPKIFNSDDGRYKHNRLKHLNMKSKCTICDMYFANLPSHIRCKHSTEICNFVCVICKKWFPRQSQLDSHFKSHSQERPYQCDICNGKYQYKSGLANHIKRVHNKEKPHMCHLCSKTFAQKNRLQIHLRSGASGHGTKTKSALKYNHHYRLHSNERPFACDTCGKKFYCRAYLKNHVVTHMEGKTKACPICDKKFYTQCGRTTHMLTHSKEKPHPCQLCELRFKRSDHRNVHERNIHGYDRLDRASKTESTTLLQHRSHSTHRPKLTP